ncbi:MAG: hypothetical protein H0U44_00830 [Flavisolibacter sp.]|jgi:hypothetical protein|nr:hypothetical protein [Flavisolibacter sp.]
MAISFTLRSFNSFLLAIFALFFVFSTTSCARKINFVASPIVPSAEGRVKVKKDNNNNYSVDLEVKHLADPSKLAQPHSIYMVWMDTESNGVQKLGQLNTSSGLLNSTMKASMETSTPYKPVRIFITGENGADLPFPGNYVVLTTSSF